MLNFRNISILFLALALLLWVSKVNSFIFVLLGLIYILILFLGSYFIQSQFYMPVICRGSGSGKKIALSFDDGPIENYTSEILGILSEKRVKAAFFCIGNRIEGREVLLQKVFEEGHLIGNHSFSHHAIFDLYSSGRMEKELQEMNELIYRLLGKRPRFFRPPYGVTNPNLARAVRRTGMVAIGWNLRSFDTVFKDEKMLIRSLMGSLEPGAVILLHDTMKITRQILADFIDAARAEGYEFTRLDNLLELEAYV